MSFAQRTAPRLMRRGKCPRACRQQRRLAHDNHGHGHAQPQPEGFGGGFYATLALIPAGYLLYTLRPSSDAAREGSWLTRLISSWREAKDDLATRNALHTKMVEQAGFDKNLFVNSPATNYVDLRFPEIINSSSPYNVPAGGGPTNLDKLVAFYQEKSEAQEQEQLAAFERLQSQTQDKDKS